MGVGRVVIFKGISYHIYNMVFFVTKSVSEVVEAGSFRVAVLQSVTLSSER